MCYFSTCFCRRGLPGMRERRRIFYPPPPSLPSPAPGSIVVVVVAAAAAAAAVGIWLWPYRLCLMKRDVLPVQSGFLVRLWWSTPDADLLLPIDQGPWSQHFVAAASSQSMPVHSELATHWDLHEANVDDESRRPPRTFMSECFVHVVGSHGSPININHLVEVCVWVPHPTSPKMSSKSVLRHAAKCHFTPYLLMVKNPGKWSRNADCHRKYSTDISIYRPIAPKYA